MEAILDWGHLAPTAPDTLSVYPFTTDDPFLLRDGAACALRRQSA